MCVCVQQTSLITCSHSCLKDRKGILSKVRSYLEGSSNKPLVIYGPSGSGKTSVMAATAYFLRERNPVKRMAIVVRFLGLTPGSSSIRHTLRSICEQVGLVFIAA